MPLESRQEAAFNAAGEAMQELGIEFVFTRRPNGLFSAYGWVGGDLKRPLVSSGYKATAAEAVNDFLIQYAEEAAKPPVIIDAGEARAEALRLVDEYRGKDPVFSPLLDELADRIAALPVK